MKIYRKFSPDVIRFRKSDEDIPDHVLEHVENKFNAKANDHNASLAPLWKALKTAKEAHQEEVDKKSSASKEKLTRLWKEVKVKEDAYYAEVERIGKAQLSKKNSHEPKFRDVENALSDPDKAKLKELKAKLEKAADGTDEEFQKAQKAYDDFLDKASKTNAKPLKIFRARNDLREEAQRGFGFLTEKTARQRHAEGTFIDYYTQSNGDKKYAKITKVSPAGYTIGGETFKFSSYDK